MPKVAASRLCSEGSAKRTQFADGVRRAEHSEPRPSTGSPTGRWCQVCGSGPAVNGALCESCQQSSRFAAAFTDPRTGAQRGYAPKNATSRRG